MQKNKHLSTVTILLLSTILLTSCWATDTPQVKQPNDINTIPVDSTNKDTIPVSVNQPIQSDLKNWSYIGTGQYTFPGWSVDYSVSLTIASGKISNASFVSFQDSGNWAYTRAQGDIDLQKIINTTGKIKVDTVTWASGTSKAIQDAVDQALAQAKN